MITRIKMNILLFVFLVIFSITVSGTIKQSKAQETIIIGSAQTQTIEVNMESLTQFVKSRQPIASFRRQSQDQQGPVRYLPSDRIKKLTKKTVKKPTSASFKNSKVIADKSKSKTSRHTTNRSKKNSQDGKMPVAVEKEKKTQIAAKTIPRVPIKEAKLDHKKFVVLFNPLAQSAGEKDLSKLKAEIKAKGFDKSQRFQLTAYSSDKNPSNARRVSLMRAISVRSFLIKMGVEGNKITVRALGNNMDAELSNRVDIVLLN